MKSLQSRSAAASRLLSEGLEIRTSYGSSHRRPLAVKKSVINLRGCAKDLSITQAHSAIGLTALALHAASAGAPPERFSLLRISSATSSHVVAASPFCQPSPQPVPAAVIAGRRHDHAPSLTNVVTRYNISTANRETPDTACGRCGRSAEERLCDVSDRRHFRDPGHLGRRHPCCNRRQLGLLDSVQVGAASRVGTVRCLRGGTCLGCGVGGMRVSVYHP